MKYNSDNILETLIVMSLVVLFFGCNESRIENDSMDIEKTVQALEETVFFDDFASGLSRWNETGEGDWNTESPISNNGYPSSGSGNPAAHSDNCDSICTITTAESFDLSAADSGQVEFLRYVSSGLDSREYLEVQLWNGTQWVREGYWTNGDGDDSYWHVERIDLEPYLGISDLAVRFNTHESYYNEHVYIDDFRVVVDGGGDYCGDNRCSGSEDCSNCDADCGACPIGCFNTCVSDNDCPSPLECLTVIDHNENSVGICADLSEACEQDSDCLVNHFCDTSTNQCVECLTDNHCIATLECRTPVCENHVCSSIVAPAGTPCGANNDFVCSTSGNCVQCFTNSHCPSDQICIAGVCVDVS